MLVKILSSVLLFKKNLASLELHASNLHDLKAERSELT